MKNGIWVRMEALEAEGATKSQLRLIEYFKAADCRQLAHCSITDLAGRAGLAESTLLRFCRALGFGGYQEFRFALANEMEIRKNEGTGCVSFTEMRYRETLEQYARGLNETLLFTACGLIRGARTVCCFGAGDSGYSALHLHSALMERGYPSHFEGDALLACSFLSSRGEGDLLVLFGAQACSKDTAEIAELARANGVKILIAACKEDSPLQRYADFTLVAFPPSKEAENGCLAEMFVVDVLLLALYRADTERVRNALARSRRATAGKLL